MVPRTFGSGLREEGVKMNRPARARIPDRPHTEPIGGSMVTTKPIPRNRPIRERLYGRGRATASGCIEWTGNRTTGGYGSMRWNGPPVPTHRIAWQLEHGSIPDGMWVLHKCDNPPCFNPEHLFLGTHKDICRTCLIRAAYIKLLGRAAVLPSYATVRFSEY